MGRARGLPGTGDVEGQAAADLAVEGAAAVAGGFWRCGRRKKIRTMPTYSTQATACSTVVAGVKLKMPLSRVAYQDCGVDRAR